MVYRCIKPQCPRDCSECNHALPEEDKAAMLVCDLLEDFAVDGFGAPLEDGESELVDRWRAWLATRRCASLPELPTCTKSQTATSDEIYELIEGAANMMRGMTLDPAIPQHAKGAMWEKIQELEKSLEKLLIDLEG